MLSFCNCLNNSGNSSSIRGRVRCSGSGIMILGGRMSTVNFKEISLCVGRLTSDWYLLILKEMLEPLILKIYDTHKQPPLLFIGCRSHLNYCNIYNKNRGIVWLISSIPIKERSVSIKYNG